MKTIILTGGGTGGHIIPCIALLPELSKHFDRIEFIGGEGMEKEMIQKIGLPFHSVSCVKFDRKNMPSNLKIPFLLAKGIEECNKILRSTQPSVVFSKGGYVSLPACFSAKINRVPLVCHESDYSLGLANRITAPFADTLLTSFPETKKGILVGNPIREEILNGDKKKLPESLSLSALRKTVLFCGGSQGATAVNEAVYRSLPALLARYNVIHLSGKKGDFSVKGNYYNQIPFTDNMADILAISDIIVCRGGANSLFEVTSLGKPTVCIPLPKGESRGDQVLNAESFRKRGLIDILSQEKLSPETLLSALEVVERKVLPPPPDVSSVNKRIAEEILRASEKKR